MAYPFFRTVYISYNERTTERKIMPLILTEESWAVIKKAHLEEMRELGEKLRRAGKIKHKIKK